MEIMVTGFPMVESGRSLLYGGNQDWFSDFWAREAGCASVSAAALSAFYGIGVEKKAVYSKEEYLALMNRMYACMTPGINGYPDPYKYRDAMLACCRKHHQAFTGTVCTKWTNAETAKQFIRESVSSGNPLALLVLEHTWQAFSDNFWHWMTIMGFSEDMLIIANYGRKEYWNWNKLLAPLPGNQVALVGFRRA